MDQNNSSYFLTTESLLEASRLINQEKMITETVGLLEPGMAGERLHRVLDIGCGPGGWLLDLAAVYPHIQGEGVDVSEPMLDHARLLSRAEGRNLAFTWMDVRNGLSFPDQTFDFIQMRLSNSFLNPQTWFPLLKECFRVLRAGGFLRVVELEMILSNKPETEEYFQLLPTTWEKAHLSFSPTGRSMGLLVHLKSLISQAGFGEQQIQVSPLDVSYGQKHYQVSLENLKVIFAGTKDLLIHVNGFSLEELVDRYHRALRVMQEHDYLCLVLLFSNCSQKPADIARPLDH